MKLNFKRLYIVLAILGLFLFGSSFQRAAAASNGAEIAVAPFLQDVQIGSDATKSFSVTYTNDSSQTQELSLSVADFGSLDNSGGVAFVGSDSGKLLDRYSLSKWLNLSENDITISPHSKKSVTATIANDPDMQPGGHYAAIVATLVKQGNDTNNTVNLKQKLSSLVFAVKTGGEKYDLQLTDIESDSGLFSLPSEADLTIKSTGNVHVVPRGIVYLKDNSGTILAKGEINQQSGYVLPGTSRTFTVELNKLASAKPWLTSYKIQADYRYDGIDQYASKSKSFRYVDLKLLAVILALLVIAFWQFRIRRKSAAKKVSKTD